LALSGFVIGIDLGLHGAFTLLDPYKREIVQIYDMPIVKRRMENLNRNDFDEASILNLVTQLKDFGTTLAVIEQPGRRPRQASAGAVTIGIGSGLLRMACRSEGLRYEEVAANVWKRKMRVPSDKWGAVQRADQLFPLDYIRFRGRLGGHADGRAESAILALYGAEVFLGIIR
jgi:hypothetical protein